MITKTLQKEFPGICVLLSALKRAWNVYKAYNKAIKDLNSVIVSEHINEWAQKVSEQSQLSYEDALYIYTFITEETDLGMVENGITEFVIEEANGGHRYYEIVRHLAGIQTIIVGP